jgi:hypothetical protein
MDPISSLGLASSVLQVVDLITKLTSQTFAVYSSVKAEDGQLKDQRVSLQRLEEQLGALQSVADGQTPLNEIALQARQLSRELQELILQQENLLKRPRNYRFLKEIVDPNSTNTREKLGDLRSRAELLQSLLSTVL